VVRGIEAAAGLRVLDVGSLPLPRPVGDGTPVDLRIDPRGERLLLVFEDEIAWRRLDGRPADLASPGWRRERPRLPPGAVIRRVDWAAGRIWITTDHGIVEAESLEGPFRRTASPVGTTDCVEVRDAPPGGVLALCGAGIFALSSVAEASTAEALVAAEGPSRASGVGPRLAPDPPLEEIRRRALLRAGLTARRSHALWAGLRRRALWPELGLRFDADFDSGWQHDRDQSFVSGDTRRLTDRRRDGGQSFGAAIQLDWDLGGVVYPEDSVDLSRELRQVVSLRDDVADEINQLYFERQAIRERLADPAAASSAETRQLFWRAHELDAGLDAWTGGWISQWRAHGAPTPDAAAGDDRAWTPDHPGPKPNGKERRE
jgi:hypothetical protein